MGDLRKNSWRKKIFFKEQSKTKEEVRKCAITEARDARSQYMDSSKDSAHGQACRLRAGEAVWDQAYVRKACRNFAEDRNSDKLVEMWNTPHPNSRQVKQGLEWLMDAGFTGRSKIDIVAETVTELLVRRVVSWEHVKEALAGFLEGLMDMMLDVPTCDLFFHALLSRLLLAFGRDFNCAI